MTILDQPLDDYHWRIRHQEQIDVAIRAWVLEVVGRTTNLILLGHVNWRIGFEFKRWERQLGKPFTLRKLLEHMWPSPQPPAEPGLNGMQHSLENGRGRFIFYGPSDLGFFNSRWHSLPEADIKRFFDSPAQQGMTHMWLSLSTGNRSKMRERTFNALNHQAQVLDKLDYIISLGIQPVLEMGTQEYMIQVLDEDPSRMQSYIQHASATFCPDRCKLAFAYREMDDLKFSNSSKRERVKAYGRHSAALSRGAGPGVTTGIHLSSLEVPSVGMFTGVKKGMWLMQWPFGQSVNASFTASNDNHDDQRFANGAAWLFYWDRNRRSKMSNFAGTIALEHSISPTTQGWGKGQSVIEAEDRGRHFLSTSACLADFSGGASR